MTPEKIKWHCFGPNVAAGVKGIFPLKCSKLYTQDQLVQPDPSDQKGCISGTNPSAKSTLSFVIAGESLGLNFYTRKVFKLGRGKLF